MQRLPRNLHLVATWRSPDNAIRKKHDTATKKWRWTQSFQKSLIKVATLIKWSGGLPKIMVLEALIKWSGILARSLN